MTTLLYDTVGSEAHFQKVRDGMRDLLPGVADSVIRAAFELNLAYAVACQAGPSAQAALEQTIAVLTEAFAAARRPLPPHPLLDGGARDHQTTEE